MYLYLVKVDQLQYFNFSGGVELSRQALGYSGGTSRSLHIIQASQDTVTLSSTLGNISTASFHSVVSAK